MSKTTAAAPAIEISANIEILMLVFELGEKEWKLGFASGFGQKPLERNIGPRDTKALLAQINWAKGKLGLADDVRIVSC